VSKVWEKDEAVAQLDQLLEQATELNGDLPFSERHTSWLLRATEFLSEVFGEDSSYYGNFRNVPWGSSPSAVIGGPARPDESWDPQRGIERVKRESFQRHLATARGVLQAAREKLAREDDVRTLYESKDTAPEASLLIKTINLAERKLRKVLRDPPADEKALQEALEDLLIGADIPYSRETKRIEYSSKTYTPDFTVDRADLAIELKVCLDGNREKALPGEINDDILAYGQEYGNLLFVVYDTGNIRDVDRFVANFEEQDSVVVRVVKH
jgi:hypothetical protein